MNHELARRAAGALLVLACAAPTVQAQVPAFLQRLLPIPLGVPGLPMRGAAQPGVMPGMGWTQDLQAAKEHAAAGRNAEAAAAYERALQAVERIPQLASMAVTILPPYGAVLVKLQRYDDAERVLARALTMESEQAAAAGGNTSFHTAQMAMRSIGRLGQDIAAQMNRSIVIDGPDGDPRSASALSLQVPQAQQPITLLAQVYVRRNAPGDREKLLDLSQVALPAYLARVASEKAKIGDGADVDAETVTFLFAAALAQAGFQEPASRAFEQALQSSRSRLDWVGRSASMMDFQQAGFQRRRLIAAAYATHAVAGPAGVAETHAVLAALTSTKGLAARFMNRRRTLLNTLPDREVTAAAAKVRALEERVRQLPRTGEPALRAYSEWTNAYGFALQPALPALARAGLTSLFTDGRSTLDAARRQVGKDAVVGFHVYEPLAFDTLQLLPARYLRYTLTQDGITLQDIGDRDGIDRLLWAWRGEVDRPALPGAGLALAKALLGGLPSQVAGAQHWIVDPDGALALLPFEALPVGAGTVLDAHRVSYTSSLAAFVETAATTAAVGPATAVIVADPRYASSEQIAAAAGFLGRRTGDSRLAALQLKPLPDTRAEAQAVASAMQRLGATPRLLLDADATPSAVRSAQAPRFLHVASHGLFLEADVDPGDSARYRLAVVVPGMLTGLALTPDSSGPMLWASDLAQMNLRGTSLVVLSACDTGNGVVEVGEGLTSLRRAAEEAGARATLTSLWPVASGRTTELMTDFYQGLAAGESKSGALRNAKLKARSRGASVRDWSGFLLAGDDR